MNISEKVPVKFTCYTERYGSAERNHLSTLFFFYPGGIWDKGTWTLAAALDTYPPNNYNWIHFDGKESRAANGARRFVLVNYS